MKIRIKIEADKQYLADARPGDGPKRSERIDIQWERNGDLPSASHMDQTLKRVKEIATEVARSL
jgi:hypothetical protein